MRRIMGHMVTDMRSSTKAANAEKRRRNQLRNIGNDDDSSDDDDAKPFKKEKIEGKRPAGNVSIPIKEEKMDISQLVKREMRLGLLQEGENKQIPKRIRRPITSRPPSGTSTAGEDTLVTSSSSLFDSSYRPCSNPIDRLCQMLMDWDMFQQKQNPKRQRYSEKT